MQHFSNNFVQILVIRSKCQRWERWSRGCDKKSRGAAVPYFSRLCTDTFFTHIGTIKRELGVIQIYFRRYPCINKNFWWSRFFLNCLDCQEIWKIPKIKLFLVGNTNINTWSGLWSLERSRSLRFFPDPKRSVIFFTKTGVESEYNFEISKFFQ